MNTYKASQQYIYTSDNSNQSSSPKKPKKELVDTPPPKINFPTKQMTDPSCLAYLGVDSIGEPIAYGTTARVFSTLSNKHLGAMVVKKVNSGGPDEFPEYFNEKLISDSLRSVFSGTKLQGRFIYIEGWSIARHNSNQPHLLLSMPMVPTTLENHRNKKSINKQDGITLIKSLLESLKSAISKGFVPMDMNGGNIFFGKGGIMLGDFQKWGVIKNSVAHQRLKSAFQSIKNEDQYILLEKYFRTYDLSEFPMYENTKKVNHTIISEIHNMLNWLKQIPSIRKHVSNMQKHAAKAEKQKSATSKSFSSIEYIDECLKYLCTTSDNEKSEKKKKAFPDFQTITRRLCFT